MKTNRIYSDSHLLMRLERDQWGRLLGNTTVNSELMLRFSELMNIYLDLKILDLGHSMRI